LRGFAHDVGDGGAHDEKAKLNFQWSEGLMELFVLRTFESKTPIYLARVMIENTPS